MLSLYFLWPHTCRVLRWNINFVGEVLLLHCLWACHAYLRLIEEHCSFLFV